MFGSRCVEVMRSCRTKNWTYSKVCFLCSSAGGIHWGPRGTTWQPILVGISLLCGDTLHGSHSFKMKLPCLCLYLLEFYQICFSGDSISVFIPRFLIQFNFILVQNKRHWSRFNPVHKADWFSQQHLLQRLPVPFELSTSQPISCFAQLSVPFFSCDSQTDAEDLCLRICFLGPGYLSYHSKVGFACFTYFKHVVSSFPIRGQL